MPEIADDSDSRIRAMKNPDERRINLLLQKLGLELCEPNAIIERESRQIGEIDGVFKFDGNLILVETKNERRLRSNLVIAFFSKWSEPEHIKLIRQRYKLPRHRIYRIFFDLSKDRPDNLGAIQPSLNEYNHILFRDDVEILEENVSLVGEWERNNFLARLGIRRRRPRTTPIKAIFCYIRDRPVYLFSLNAKELLECAHITRRYKHDPGYQRATSDRRIRSMRRGILSGAILAFPNSILVNSRNKLLEKQPLPQDSPASVDINLPVDYSFLKVIDGQHRMLAFTGLPDQIKEDHDLLIVAFEELSPEEETEIFIVINTTQKRVDPNLVLLLKADHTTDPSQKFWFEKVAVETAMRLNKTGPLKGKIFMGYADEKWQGKWIRLKTLVSAMKANRFVGRLSPFQETPEDIDTPTETIQDIFKLLKKNKLLSESDTFFLEGKGIRILFRYVHLVERNKGKGYLSISLEEAISALAGVFDDEIRKLVKGYYGPGGAKRAVDTLTSRLKGKFTSFEHFRSDLRYL